MQAGCVRHPTHCSRYNFCAVTRPRAGCPRLARNQGICMQYSWCSVPVQRGSLKNWRRKRSLIRCFFGLPVARATKTHQAQRNWDSLVPTNLVTCRRHANKGKRETRDQTWPDSVSAVLYELSVLVWPCTHEGSSLFFLFAQRCCCFVERPKWVSIQWCMFFHRMMCRCSLQIMPTHVNCQAPLMSRNSCVSAPPALKFFQGRAAQAKAGYQLSFTLLQKSWTRKKFLFPLAAFDTILTSLSCLTGPPVDCSLCAQTIASVSKSSATVVVAREVGASAKDFFWNLMGQFSLGQCNVLVCQDTTTFQDWTLAPCLLRTNIQDAHWIPLTCCVENSIPGKKEGGEYEALSNRPIGFWFQNPV